MRKLFWFLPILLMGCVSTHDLGNGRVAVPRTAEVRSPYGTNVTFGKLDDCEKAASPNKGAQEWIN